MAVFQLQTNEGYICHQYKSVRFWFAIERIKPQNLQNKLCVSAMVFLELNSHVCWNLQLALGWPKCDLKPEPHQLESRTLVIPVLARRLDLSKVYGWGFRCVKKNNWWVIWCHQKEILRAAPLIRLHSCWWAHKLHVGQFQKSPDSSTRP